MTFLKLLTITFLCMHLLVSGCSSTTDKNALEISDQNTAKQPLAEDDVANAVYRIDSIGEFRLNKGMFVHQYGEGMTQRFQVTLEKAALGDLDRDGREDAAVVLAVQSGGSGTFRYLIAMQNTGNETLQQDSLLLGDHVQIHDLAIAEGQVRLEMLQPTPNNPVCCPTQQVKQTFSVNQGKWVRLSNEITPSTRLRDPKAMIMSIVWQWERYEDPFHSNYEVVDDPNKYTLIFLPNGSYRVKADCNRMQGQYTREDSTLKIVPGAATLAECGPESRSMDYLKNLTEAVSFEIHDNKLVLNLVMGGERLIFRNGGSAPP